MSDASIEHFSIVIGYAILSGTDRAYQRNPDGSYRLLLCINYVAMQLGLADRSPSQLIRNVFARYHQLPEVLQKMGIKIDPCPGPSPSEYEPWAAANFRNDYPHRDLQFDDHHLTHYWMYMAMVFRDGQVIDFGRPHYIFLTDLTRLLGFPRYQGSLLEAHNTWILHHMLHVRDEVDGIYDLFGVRVAKQIFTPSWCIEYRAVKDLGK